MWWVIFLVVIYVPTAVESLCMPYTYGNWRSWSSCTANCGGGTQTRYRVSCVFSDKDWQTEPCNTICYNTGSYRNSKCSCPGWRYGSCCENCNVHHFISKCKPNSIVCGGYPDNVKCTACEDPYYSGGYAKGCKLCPHIAHCKDRHCTQPGNNKCLQCIENFKRINGDTQCEQIQGCPFVKENGLSWSIRNNSGRLDKLHSLVSVGSVLDLQCRGPYYKKIETTIVSCLQNGTYNAVIPKCQEIECLEPESIENGKYTHAEKINYRVGDVISLQCNEGFQPRLPQLRECLNTSQWSGIEPICTLIVCPFPDNFMNGTLSLPNGTEFISGVVPRNTVVNVSCEEDLMASTNIAQCTIKGEWDNSPSCSPIKCQRLGNMSGGSYAYSKAPIYGKLYYPIGTIATTKCSLNKQETREEIGTGTFICGQNGNWIGNQTYCEIECLEPESIENGKYTHAEKINYRVGDVISLKCNEGFQPRLPQLRECLNTSQWSGIEAICTLIVCPFPDNFMNGTLSLPNGTEFISGVVPRNTVVNVSCEEDLMASTNIAQCTIKGVWDLGNLSGGSYAYSKAPIYDKLYYPIGTIATTKCSLNKQETREEIGTGTFICGQNGNWIGNQTYCAEIEEHSPSSTAVIVGASVSAAIVAFLVVLFVFIFRKRTKRTERKQQAMDESQQYDNSYFEMVGHRSNADEDSYTNLKF